MRIWSCFAVADLIDAAWAGEGNNASSDYTSVVWVDGEGKGTTITPAGGDTGKTLFFPNAGRRIETGESNLHATWVWFWSVYQNRDYPSSAYDLYFSDQYPSGRIGTLSLNRCAYSLRCVRS